MSNFPEGFGTTISPTPGYLRALLQMHWDAMTEDEKTKVRDNLNEWRAKGSKPEDFGPRAVKPRHCSSEGHIAYVETCLCGETQVCK